MIGGLRPSWCFSVGGGGRVGGTLWTVSLEKHKLARRFINFISPSEDREIFLSVLGCVDRKDTEVRQRDQEGLKPTSQFALGRLP